jgi:uncharacterized protein YprB with RNaseH-like and TPR domain
VSSAPEAYLDIETTGLEPSQNEITVVGIYIVKESKEDFIQLVGSKISGEAILRTLQGVTSLYTYNGRRFDLPFIHVRHGVNLESHISHCDLMYHCWRNNLYGGLKAVERSLGIERRIKEVDGFEAVQLWWRYIHYGDLIALQKLLDYNKEDVINLKILKEKVYCSPL